MTGLSTASITNRVAQRQKLDWHAFARVDKATRSLSLVVGMPSSAPHLIAHGAGAFGQAAVDQVKALLRRERAVPMPTGQAALFAPTACHAEATTVDAPARAYCLIAMLCGWAARWDDSTREALKPEGGPLDRWMPAHWSTYASLWFERVRVEHELGLVPGSHRQRAELLLQAVADLALEPCAAAPGILSTDQLRHQQARARQRIAQGRTAPATPELPPTGLEPAPLGVVDGSHGLLPEPGWEEARRLLREERTGNAATAQMLYFFHVLHCLLCIEQPPLDEANGPRRAFYRPLVAVLRQLGEPPGCRSTGFARAAGGIADALLATALLSLSAADASLKISAFTAAMQAPLPSCFVPNTRTSAPPSLAIVRHHLADAKAGERLAQAHALALAVIDHLLDPLRTRVERVPPSTSPPSAAASTPQERLRAELRRQLFLGPTQLRAPGWLAEDTQYVWGRSHHLPMAERYAAAHEGQMRDALRPTRRRQIAEIAVRRLQELANAGQLAVRWQPDRHPSPCALCQVQAVEPGP